MSKTLLLADDSVVIQKLVGLSFANEDIEIVSTDNGDDAVARAREVRPDVVLADVVMPGKSGYEVCEAIKQDPGLAHVPVLLLTGTFEAFDEGRASAAGADGHITKPFEAQALVERVKTVIRNAARPASETARPEASARGARVLSADDLFAGPATASAVGSVSATDDFFGRAESLDVTPSLGETDLEGPLETDFFGEGGEEIGRTSFSADSPPGAPSGIAPLPPLSGRGAATGPVVPEPTSARSSPAPVAPPARFDDLDFSAPPALPPIAARELDLDAVFDSGSPLAASSPSIATPAFDRAEPGDANASTATGSFAPVAAVTDLDELLEQSRGADAALPFEHPSERPPDAPRALDLRPFAPQPADDLDFGFDVSEQTTIAKVDLLEESFSSLLDVSDSQLLADPSPLETSVEVPPPAEIPIAAYDVSASDLPPAFEPLVAPPPLPVESPKIAGPGASPGASLSDSGFALLLDVVADEPNSALPEPPPIPTPNPSPSPNPNRTATPIATTASEAVAHLTPVLQQHVQETLEKVAWEAFSDLSDTIVKQVMERVERIAWEVIPQMAETLVREEIRKMKGEED